jgi:hypothetical protein
MARISGVSVTTVSVAEALVLDGVTGGTVTASKALVVDSNKDLSALRTVVVTNIDAGASGTAGTVDIFPTTASKGKIAIAATDSTGNTTTTITNAAQSAAATLTIPDTNGAAEFVMTAAAQTVTGVKQFNDINIGASGTVGAFDIFPATAAKGKLNILAANNTGDTTNTITNAAQSAAATWTIPDTNGAAGFVMTAAAQTIGGAKTFSTMPIIPVATVAATGTVQGDAAAITTGFTLVTGADDAKGVKLPAAAAGLMCIIKVGDGADLKVYPDTGDAINAIAANSPITVVDDVCFALIALDGTTWYTLPLLPS